MNALSERITLNFRSNEPLYLQIARQVEQLVAAGALQVGDQLPTVRELATGLRINFNTVARAYRVLDDARLISTQRGRGTYIWEQPTEAMTEQLRQQTLEELARKYLHECGQLGYGPAAAAEKIQTLIQAGDTRPGDENGFDQEL